MPEPTRTVDTEDVTLPWRWTDRAGDTVEVTLAGNVVAGGVLDSVVIVMTPETRRAMAVALLAVDGRAPDA